MYFFKMTANFFWKNMPRALISVSDKEGVFEFAKGLEKIGFEILSTGGTFKVLAEKGIKNLVEISEFTGFPEGLGGRIKTLDPHVFGAILNRRDSESDQKFCRENGLKNIDLVVVNLYPFKKTSENPSADFAAKIEQIDIGGPSMIRAAAKNFAFCAPVVDPADYEKVLDFWEKTGDLPLDFRKSLATKVFEMTAFYDLLIARFWRENSAASSNQNLRYGENPHQKAVSLRDPFAPSPSLLGAEILNGKPLSFNNLADAAAALELALAFSDVNDPAFATIFKHQIPCGAATGDSVSDAFEKAHAADPVSAFGGVIALSRECDQQTAEKIADFFCEIVIAPSFSEESLSILRQKKDLRLLQIPDFAAGLSSDFQIKRIRGGALVQDADTFLPDFEKIFATNVPTKNKPSEREIADLIFGWKVVKIIKSNAIAVIKNGTLIGKGGGQTSRVSAAEMALEGAGVNARGAVVASDAFFPFPDSVEKFGSAGISAIIQPGGSKNDSAVLAACDQMQVSCTLTDCRAFLH